MKIQNTVLTIYVFLAFSKCAIIGFCCEKKEEEEEKQNKYKQQSVSQTID